MDTATPTHAADQPARVAASVRQSRRRRRRPSGAPPPLPRHLETTGVGWLLAAVGLVVVFTVSFAASRHGAAVAVTAADDRVARWLTGLRSGWLTNGLQVVAFPASWLASKILAWCIVVPLLVFKRFRHLVGLCQVCVWLLVCEWIRPPVQAEGSCWQASHRPSWLASAGAWRRSPTTSSGLCRVRTNVPAGRATCAG